MYAKVVVDSDLARMEDVFKVCFGLVQKTILKLNIQELNIDL